jgi:hypothetical protein
VAYDEGLAERIRGLAGARPGVTERKMFGGIVWMVGGNMACGVMGAGVLVRMKPEDREQALTEPHVGEFGMPGRRPMGGFVLVAAEGIAEDADLARWVDLGAGFAASLPQK